MIVDWLDWFADLLDPYTDVIGALAAIVTAIIAVIALSSTAKDSRERSRPLVIAFFRMAKDNDGAFELVVRNYGQSGAKDLRVTFDPSITAEAQQTDAVAMLARRYEVPIALLPPTAELTNTWWRNDHTTGQAELPNAYGTPDQVVVRVSYRGYRWRRYSDEFPLDVNTIKLTTYSVSSTSMPSRVKSIAESLRGIEDGLGTVNSNLRQMVPKEKE